MAHICNFIQNLTYCGGAGYHFLNNLTKGLEYRVVEDGSEEKVNVFKINAILVHLFL